jgi:hypothetical protein
MSTDLILGTLLGFSLSVLLAWGILWLQRLDYEKQLREYNARLNNNPSLLPYSTKKKVHLKIVRNKKDD